MRKHASDFALSASSSSSSLLHGSLRTQNRLRRLPLPPRRARSRMIPWTRLRKTNRLSYLDGVLTAALSGAWPAVWALQKPLAPSRFWPQLPVVFVRCAFYHWRHTGEEFHLWNGTCSCALWHNHLLEKVLEKRSWKCDFMFAFSLFLNCDRLCLISHIFYLL